MSTSTLRKYATPLTIGSFILMAVTGTLMFFHLNTTFNKVAHEYLGIVMIAAVVLHLVLNWRAFTTYFKRPLAMCIMGIFILALGLSFIPSSQKGGRPEFGAVRMVISAPVSTLAPMLGTDTQGVIDRLAAQDVAATPDQSLSDLTGGEMGKAAALLVALKQ
ncbi:protein of unknown function [Thalassovita litoralis]|jgi:uncharacterized RDD family membrane protein YckC|uniref:Flavinylation-associated cytochrome domain-containing protein n=1 Tax=Thalassovita litoralis TaxID=1010611 RepID=A0A521AC06_9RHOB|nr:DUF4405 domain-containing protein [Thalassovita litoralis]SMO32316.1 protein of unknown function [Thalassovita litoralis]